MKNIFILFVLALFGVTCVVTTADAASTRDGKRKFKKYCYKKCHNGDDAEEIQPTYMTIAQWKDLFKSNNEVLKELHPDNELDKVKKLKKKHYKNMEKYLIKHAIDSEQPETCG